MRKNIGLYGLLLLEEQEKAAASSDNFPSVWVLRRCEYHMTEDRNHVVSLLAPPFP